MIEKEGSGPIAWSSTLLLSTLSAVSAISIFLLSLDSSRAKRKRRREQEMSRFQSQYRKVKGRRGEEEEKGGVLGNLVSDITKTQFPRSFQEI